MPRAQAYTMPCASAAIVVPASPASHAYSPPATASGISQSTSSGSGSARSPRLVGAGSVLACVLVHETAEVLAVLNGLRAGAVNEHK